MTYRHDVFISYRREPLWTPWTRNHVRSLLSAYLQQDLGFPPDIFVDDRIEIGSDWVEELGEHLATSKVMVVIFSGDYFGSDWCLNELDLMLARAKEHSDKRLIIPVIGHDGDAIPDIVKKIQPADFRDFRRTHICCGTPLYERFDNAVCNLSPAVAKAVRTAPDFDGKWVGHHKQRFDLVYSAFQQGKPFDPVHFVAKRPGPPTGAPKLF